MSNNKQVIAAIKRKTDKNKLAELIKSPNFDPNEVDFSDLTPLMWAVIKGNITAIHMLADKKEAINFQNNKGYSALIYAITVGNLDAVQALLKTGADVNSKDKIGYTPLHFAVSKGNEDIVRTLIEAGAEIDVRGNDQYTPMHLAIKNNNFGISNILAEKGSKINPTEVILSHTLLNVTNDQTLRSLLAQNDPANVNEGGMTFEGVSIIRDFLKNFIKENNGKYDENSFKPILTALYNFTENKNASDKDIISAVERGELIVLKTGFIGHDIYVSLEHENTNASGYASLSLAERGVFDERDENDEGIAKSVRTINIPIILLPEVIKLLKKAENSKESESADILFEQLPELVKNQYSSTNIRQKPFKSGQCFFENLKTLLLCEFVKKFGENEGKKIYKEFDIFMHQEALKNYQEKSNDINKNTVVDLCQYIIHDKNEKLQSNTKQPSLVSMLHNSEQLAQQLVEYYRISDKVSIHDFDGIDVNKFELLTSKNLINIYKACGLKASDFKEYDIGKIKLFIQGCNSLKDIEIKTEKIDPNILNLQQHDIKNFFEFINDIDSFLNKKIAHFEKNKNKSDTIQGKYRELIELRDDLHTQKIDLQQIKKNYQRAKEILRIHSDTGPQHIVNLGFLRKPNSYNEFENLCKKYDPLFQLAKDGPVPKLR